MIATMLVTIPATTAFAGPLRVDGLITAVFSPFDKAGGLNTTVVAAQVSLGNPARARSDSAQPRSVARAQADYLAATGVQWAFVGGTTGESVKMSVAERKSLFEAWAKTKLQLIAHVGAEALADSHDLAVHAVQHGARAVAAMPPTFFKPASAEALGAWMATVCAAAPDLPCYYYHIPSMTGVATSYSMLDFVKAVEPLSPNFAGVKYTGLYTYPGFMDAQKVMDYKGGKYEVFSGREEMMLEALSIGVKGHVGSQFNFAGDLYNELRTSFAKEGLTAASQKKLRGLQLRSLSLIDAWKAPADVNGAKFFMTLAGVPVGDARLPNLPVTAAAPALGDAFDTFCASPSPYMPAMRMCAQRE